MNARRLPEIPRRGSVLRFRFPLATLAFAATTLALALAGCGFNTHGSGLGGNGGNGGSLPCNVNSQCNDQNPCTKDSCGADKLCVFAPLDGVPSPDQKAGDCKTVQCQKGKAVDKNDDTDVPDDGKDCTIDSCNGGTPSHVPKPTDTVCQSAGNAGTCDAQGKCEVVCTTADQCAPTPPNPCVTPTCDASSGHCVDPIPQVQDGTPSGLPDTKGDCKVPVCMSGMPVDGVDESDVPVTATDCDQEICTGNVPSNPPLPLDHACMTYMGSTAGFCDGMGTCQQCAKDTDCPGPTDDCKHPACSASFTCTVAFTTAGTATTSNPPQVVGDCQKIVCDSMGGTMVVTDLTDPLSDGNQCTTDTCTGPNATQSTNVTDGTSCGNGLACKNGTCNGCTVANQMQKCPQATCQGTVLTKSSTCDTMANCVGNGTQDCAPYLCSASNNNCTSSCNNDPDCAGGNYCTGNNGTCLTKITQGNTCTADHQCGTGHCVDGVCCNTGCGGLCQACSAAKTGGTNGFCAVVTTGTDPDNECADQGGASCGTTGFCSNGACALYPNTQVCGAQGCKDSVTQNNQRLCNGNGACGSQTTTACMAYMCKSGACLTNCGADSDCAPGDWCNGGMCVAKGVNGTACSGGNQCGGSGNCVDGVCCNNACNQACQACAASKKASGAANGTCGAAAAAVTDPRGICAVTAQTSCGTDGTCTGLGTGSGACADWSTSTTCVAASCTGSTLTNAKTCNGSGMCNQGGGSMTCGAELTCNAAMSACLTGCGTSDSSCAANYYCDGVGNGTCVLQKAGGSACGGNHECTSNSCGNGFCCTAACPTGGGTCGVTGCDSTGACVYALPSTPCVNGSCGGSGGKTLSGLSVCDGIGGCQPVTSNDCPGGQCSSTGCSKCSNDGDCTLFGYCVNPGANGACSPRALNGGACSANNQCVSGSCIGGTTCG